MSTHQQYIAKAVDLARAGMKSRQGGPFGCVIVKNGSVVGEGHNQVTSSLDPTAHAEIVTIRKACRHLNTFQLDGTVLYTTCEPCPMCLGAIYWARVDQVVFAGTRQDAAVAGFDDQFIYEELETPAESRKIPMQFVLDHDVKKLFNEWLAMEDKVHY